MKEIVTIQVGQCGNTVGGSFWEEVSKDHGITPEGIFCGENMESQLAFIECMFVQGALGGGQNFVPRCVMLDLDPSSMDTLRCSPYGQLFRPDNFIFGKNGSGNNFARGYFTEGKDIQDASLDVIRQEIERCDFPVGFQMFGAIGGGTGSGLGALMLEHLKDDYPKLVVTNYSVIPGGGLCSDAVVEPLNATLAAPSLINCSDLTICMDNQSLYDICQNTLKLEAPLYSDLNDVMVKVIAGLSATYRFKARRHVSWRSLKCFLVPSPKLHFFVPSFAPLNSRGVQAYRNFSTFDITYQLLNGVDTAIMGPGVQKMKTPLGKYLTALTLYRGFSVWDEEVTQLLFNFQQKNLSQFVDWMPYHFLKGMTEVPPKGMKIASTMIANHTGAQRKLWGDILKKYQGITRRKAFVHWYYSEGMEEDDFTKSEAELVDFIEEYTKAETDPPKDWVPLNEDQMYKKCYEDDDEEIIPVPPKIIPISLDEYCATNYTPNYEPTKV